MGLCFKESGEMWMVGAGRMAIDDQDILEYAIYN
jgi:hypothetical protein